jgi:hypothetical protein
MIRYFEPMYVPRWVKSVDSFVYTVAMMIETTGTESVGTIKHRKT